jgi:UDP-glucose 4-epimerase
MNEVVDVFNVGTGKGNTVLELIETFVKVNNQKLNYSIGDRRPGDIEAIYTDTSKIESKLGWKAKKELPTSMKDSFEWEKSLL